MKANDAFASLEKKEPDPSSRTSESALITLERCQKLDLLIHLISNLRQALVICGSNGIGKTTLLEELKQKKIKDWPIYSILATSGLSFESIQSQIIQFFVQQYPAYKHQSLSFIFSELEKQNQKVVVIIDNAGLLVPGLIQTLIQYAASTLCLRIVFSLTHDEIQLKNSTDRAIEDCHFIEIPALTEKQCGIFLKNLSTQPGAKFPLSVCNDRLIEKVYRETHGVPGRIVATLPKLSEYRTFNDYNWLSTAFITIVAVLAISFFVTKKPEIESKEAENISSALFQKAEKLEQSYTQTRAEIKSLINREYNEEALKKNNTDVNKISLDVKSEVPVNLLDDDIKKLNQGKNILLQQKSKQNDKNVTKGVIREVKKLEKDLTARDKEFSTSVFAEIKNTNDLNESLLKQETKKSKAIQDTGSGKGSIEKLEKKKSTNVETGIIPVRQGEKSLVVRNTAKTDKVITQILRPGNSDDTKKDNSQWVMQQAVKNYTIQLMVLSKRQSVMAFLKKNKSLKENLKFFRKNGAESKKYVLIYGVFKNIRAATKKMDSLPVEYRKSWIRRFGTLQKELNNN